MQNSCTFDNASGVFNVARGGLRHADGGRKLLFTMDLKAIPLIRHTDSGNFFVMAGPCVVEGEEMAMRIAERLTTVCDNLRLPLIFKGSYRKANRSRIDSFSGIGDEKALKILAKVRAEFGVPIVTDFHSAAEADMAAEYVDVLQVPAFLCRQTDILAAAARTGKVVNVKKGQFLAPEAMGHVVKKIVDSGNNNVIVTDRGTMFGYYDLIVDYRGLPAMRQFAPVVLDVTHSLQQPNQASGVTGGKPALIETVARAGVAVGVDGLFLETHFDPPSAKSDGANMLRLDLFEPLMKRLTALRSAINAFE